MHEQIYRQRNSCPDKFFNDQTTNEFIRLNVLKHISVCACMSMHSVVHMFRSCVSLCLAVLCCIPACVCVYTCVQVYVYVWVVCMCIVCACVCVCMYVCVGERICIYLSVCVCVFMLVCVCCVRVCCMCVCMFMLVCVCIWVGGERRREAKIFQKNVQKSSKN